MTALYIILGIVVFFAALLTIPVIVDLEYTDVFKCSVSWLFLKFNLYPPAEKKKKKTEKEKKPKEKPAEEKKPEDKPAVKKENFLKTFYNNQGVGGIVELIQNCAAALGKFSKSFAKSFYIRKLHIKISVTESDAAQTAIKYGKICRDIYPALGLICSTSHVKNYKVNIWADYCGEKTNGELVTRVAVIPRRIINGGIAMVFRLGLQLIKVVISNNKELKKQNLNKKGGQTQ